MGKKLTKVMTGEPPMEKHCPICQQTTPQRAALRGKNFQLTRCRYCGLVSTTSTPAVKVIEYDQKYFENTNAYLQKEAEFRGIFSHIFDLIGAYLPARGNLLDVGCGVGLLLDVARQRGYRVCGVEISPYAADIARQRYRLEVNIGTLQDAKYQDRSFDVVIMNHVLEHLPEPLAVLSEIRRILKPGGVLAAGVPNFSSIFRRALRSRWPSLLPEQHLWHFSPATLEKLLAKSGFAVEAVKMVDNHPYHHHLPAPVGFIAKALSSLALAVNRADSMMVVGKMNP